MKRRGVSAKAGRDLNPRLGASKGRSKTVRIALHGASGRMGARILAALPDYPDLKLVATLSAADRLRVKADVLVDFSTPDAVRSRLVEWGKAGAALVIGTTGLAPATLAGLDHLSKRVPVLVASNTSRGANALMALAEAAARLLPGWEAQMVETHHRGKKDAPSGTALSVAEAFRRGGGTLGPVHALRIGDVVGEHELLLFGRGERIRISHAAEDRAIFARGALEAARFLAGARPGRYAMSDVLASR